MSKSLFVAFCLMFLSTFLVIVGDTGAKLLSQSGFSPLFVAWSRFAIASVVLLPFSGLKKSELRGLLDWRVILRASLICGAICCVLTAIERETLANVFGAFFIGPIVSYTLSRFLLKEHISWQRTALLGISFIGVLIVVRPGFGMTVGMAFGVAAGVFHGCYLLTTRWLVTEYRPRFLLISQLIVGAVLLLPFSTIDVPSFTVTTTGLITLSALGSAVGNLIMVLVNKNTTASVVAPLIYLQLISAMIMGYLVFYEVPDLQSLIGLAIILFAGLSSLWFAGKGR